MTTDPDSEEVPTVIEEPKVSFCLGVGVIGKGILEEETRDIWEVQQEDFCA